eukprot:6300957-Prymnesium_polylepis.1
MPCATTMGSDAFFAPGGVTDENVGATCATGDARSSAARLSGSRAARETMDASSGAIFVSSARSTSAGANADAPRARIATTIGGIQLASEETQKRRGSCCKSRRRHVELWQPVHAPPARGRCVLHRRKRAGGADLAEPS